MNGGTVRGTNVQGRVAVRRDGPADRHGRPTPRSLVRTPAPTPPRVACARHVRRADVRRPSAVLPTTGSVRTSHLRPTAPLCVSMVTGGGRTHDRGRSPRSRTSTAPRRRGSSGRSHCSPATARRHATASTRRWSGPGSAGAHVRSLQDPESWVRTVAWRTGISRWRRVRTGARLMAAAPAAGVVRRPRGRCRRQPRAGGGPAAAPRRTSGSRSCSTTCATWTSSTVAQQTGSSVSAVKSAARPRPQDARRDPRRPGARRRDGDRGGNHAHDAPDRLRRPRRPQRTTLPTAFLPAPGDTAWQPAPVRACCRTR